ncbi:hypothetical protein NXV86_24305 [Bacteroides sp. BFG-257]|uniref:hypothetical protein n=1 Tax=Bacteroides sp. BFG-257 TaxID=2972761 RepID=UPI002161CAC9|nr:hypothetical protein [Bacteroides sp. BFG-257]UVO97919.1 hypothetical protein NXV86_24305 [Bacteroides sp. BFG-257]
MIIGFIRSIVSQKRIRFVSAPCLLRIISVSTPYLRVRRYYGDDTDRIRRYYGADTELIRRNYKEDTELRTLNVS